MATKLICCSFEPGSMGGFITICNGVKHSRAEHYSKTIAVTKEAFIAACKDRVLFNDLLGVDVRNGWQNALAAAIFPFQTMTEEFDPDTAAKVSSELDVQMRGEDAVKEDIEKVEKQNEELEKATKKVTKKTKRAAKTEPEQPKVEENEPRPVESTDNSSPDTGSESGSELPADGPRAESAE